MIRVILKIVIERFSVELGPGRIIEFQCKNALRIETFPKSLQIPIP